MRAFLTLLLGSSLQSAYRFLVILCLVHSSVFRYNKRTSNGQSAAAEPLAAALLYFAAGTPARLKRSAVCYDQHALENLGVPTGEMRTRVDDAMKLAGIYEQRNKAPHKLSGGQKQRVAIAGVIAMRPDCLILDESTAMLDPRGRAQVMKTIRNLRDAGISIVSITHYMEEAAQADRILVMSRGRIVMEGTPKQVFSQTKRLHGYHLDVPQATELRDELAAAGLPMPENIITPEECAKAIFDLLK